MAKLGAAFLCASLGITPEILQDHAAYIGDWIVILKEGNRTIFRAAARAEGSGLYQFVTTKKAVIAAIRSFIRKRH